MQLQPIRNLSAAIIELLDYFIDRFLRLYILILFSASAAMTEQKCLGVEQILHEEHVHAHTNQVLPNCVG